jgi:hypothetical protein
MDQLPPPLSEGHAFLAEQWRATPVSSAWAVQVALALASTMKRSKWLARTIHAEEREDNLRSVRD